MKKFQAPKKSLYDYLKGSMDYLGVMPRDIFLQYLYSIENVEDEFQKLLNEFPEWAELAETRQPEFFLVTVKHKSYQFPGEPYKKLELCIFDRCIGACPVVKIENHVVPI